MRDAARPQWDALLGSGKTYGPAIMLLPRLEQGTADNVFKNMEMCRCIGFSPANWPLLQND